MKEYTTKDYSKNDYAMNDYTTALYIRLSQEDDNAGESDSVKNQRDLLNDFVSKHPDLSASKVLHFVDDGYSGTNFNRPAVTKMLEQVRKGKIQAIVVKDFSRFGRNYIEVCGYLEQVFPFLGVRFLSVNDLFDSNNNQGRSAGLEVGFKTLIHDLYSKDLGVKSMSGKIAKTKKGEHLGGTAPFGYIKSKTIKNAWDIDEAAAVTIRRIYALTLEGKSYIEIAAILNAEDVPTPLKHRQNNNTLHQVINGATTGMSVWRKENVSRILRDERYTGKLISGKMKAQAYGAVKTKSMPKSDWIVVENAHEPIISQEVFDKAQANLKPYHAKTLTRRNTNLYAGKLFCGHCGHGLRRYGERADRPNSKTKPRYICRFSMELKLERCLPEQILESQISEVVLEALKVEIALAQKAKRQAEKRSNGLMGKHDKLLAKQKQLSLELERSKATKEQLFEKFADGKLSKEQYIQVKTEQSSNIASIETEIEQISVAISDIKLLGKNDTKCDIILPYSGAKEVTKEMVALIKRINVYADNRFEVIFAFSQ